MKSSVLPDNILKLMSPQDRAALGKAGRTMDEISADNEKKLESEFQKDIGNYLRLKDIVYGWSRMDRKTTTFKGWPDFVFAIRGRAIALEAKVGKRQTTPEQDQTHAAMRANGWEVHVVRTFPEVVAIIKRHLEQ